MSLTEDDFSIFEQAMTTRIVLNGSGYLLSFLVGVSLNLYIIRRLVSKDVKKTNYFRLLIFKSCVDIYLAVYATVAYCIALFNFVKTKATTEKSPIFASEFVIRGYFFDVPTGIQRFLVLIIIIHWKTVVIKKPRTDKFLYISSTIMAILNFAYDTYMANKNYQRSSTAELILAYCTGALMLPYFVFFFVVSVYCIVAVFRIDTGTYSPQTLKAYRRMVLVHFIQSLLIVIDYILQVLFPILWLVYMIINLHGLAQGQIDHPNETEKLMDQYREPMLEGLDIGLKGVMVVEFFFAVKPCLNAVFMYWALRRLLRSAVKKVPIIHLKKNNSAEQSVARKK